jgi:hypothetical protein
MRTRRLPSKHVQSLRQMLGEVRYRLHGNDRPSTRLESSFREIPLGSSATCSRKEGFPVTALVTATGISGDQRGPNLFRIQQVADPTRTLYPVRIPLSPPVLFPAPPLLAICRLRLVADLLPGWRDQVAFPLSGANSDADGIACERERELIGPSATRASISRSPRHQIPQHPQCARNSSSSSLQDRTCEAPATRRRKR